MQILIVSAFFFFYDTYGRFAQNEPIIKSLTTNIIINFDVFVNNFSKIKKKK